MIDVPVASSSIEAGREVAKNLPSHSLESDFRLYSVLVALSFDYIQHKAYSVVPTFVTFHSSLTLIAAVAGVSRWTARRSLARLKAMGVVDARLHKVMFRGRASNSGCVFQVRLNPNEGSKAKLSYSDLRHSWHDLNRAARAKTLSYQVMPHIEEISAIEVKYQVLKEHSFKTFNLKPVTFPYMVQGGLESLLAISGAQGKEVAERVDQAAQALATALADTKSTDFYRKLMWALKRRINAGGRDELHTVYLQANRVVNADHVEWPGLRSPGALLVSRLRKYPFWQDVMTT